MSTKHKISRNLYSRELAGQKVWLILVQIDGYNCFYRDKRSASSNHDGLITYVDDNFEANDPCIGYGSSVWETLFVQIKTTGHSRDIIIGSVYKPQKDNNSIDNIQTFTSELKTDLFSLKTQILKSGDYNITPLNLECGLSFEEFLDPMLSNSFYTQITLPTRLGRNTCTLIDGILVKLSSSYKDRMAGIIFTRMSYHFPSFLGFKMNTNVDIKRARYIKQRVYTNEALQNFRGDIEKSNIFDHLGHDPYQDPNTNYNILHDKLMKLKKTPYPLQKVR